MSNWKVFDTRKTSAKQIESFLKKNTFEPYTGPDKYLGGAICHFDGRSCKVNIAKPYVIIEIQDEFYD